MFASRTKIAAVAFGDIFSFYIALVLTILIRYGRDFSQPLESHIKPFSLLIFVWLAIFYIFDLYKERFFRWNFEALQNFIPAISVSVLISAVIFYLFESFFNLTPKTNLLIFGSAFFAVDYLWRKTAGKIFASAGLKSKMIFIGRSPNFKIIADYLEKNPQLGYKISFRFEENLNKKNFSRLSELISAENIEAAVIDSKSKKRPSSAKFIYQFLPLDVKIIALARFFETLFGKVPMEELEESWFVEEISTGRRFYDAGKRIIDVSLAIFLIAVFSPLIALIAVLIKINSRGPAVYRQKRAGKNDEPFILYKFRTMKTDVKGPLATKKNDRRITAVGKILRYTHLDELPQLLNIIKGDISFIGPRPESSELVEIYKKLPYYEIRHIIKPGLTGWAQVNYKPSASLEEAKEKLQYDIYYVKNRSFILDLLILLKTIKYFFASHY